MFNDQPAGHARTHPITVSVIVLICVGISVGIWFAAQWASMPGETSFLVTGETTELTFHAAAQEESQDQAGIFASSDRTVDLQISCTSIQQTAYIREAVACRDGMLSLEHLSVAKVRLNGDTRVDLAVADGNLTMTLTQDLGGHPAVTLFSVGREITNLIVRMARENSDGGYDRIAGALKTSDMMFLTKLWETSFAGLVLLPPRSVVSR